VALGAAIRVSSATPTDDPEPAEAS